MATKKLQVHGLVVAVRVGDLSVKSTPRDKIELHVRHGVRGDRHAGPRLADARDQDMLSAGLLKGTETANVRELSIVSLEELAGIASLMGLPERIPIGMLGENLVLSGIPRLTSLPPGTKLFFRSAKDRVRSAVIAVWGPNDPCVTAGGELELAFPDENNVAGRFVKAAVGKRGVVGFVYSSGFIAGGDTVIAHIPKQELYKP